MRIASFDIGKCNFAFYVEEFDKDTLEKLANIPKNKRSTNDGFVSEDYHTVLKEVYLNGTTILYRNLDLTQGTRKDKYLDQKVCLNMITELDKVKDFFDTCDIIVIEQQMSFKAVQNTMAIKLAQNCASYFLHRYGETKEIVEFPAFHKTQVFGAPKKLSKTQRKKWATEKAISIIMERGEMETLDEITNKKKKDDLADVLVQLQSFKYLRFVDKTI
jgi:hypothetical protein